MSRLPRSDRSEWFLGQFVLRVFSFLKNRNLRAGFLLSALSLVGSPIVAQPTASSSVSNGQWLGMDNVSQRYVPAPIVDLWYYHQTLSTGAYSNMATLRVFHPISNPWGQWRGVFRLDQSYYNSFGPSVDDPNNKTYQRGNTMITIWGNHPHLFSSWHGDLGLRVILPVGNEGQWAVGPQAGVSYQTRKPEGQVGLSDFSPLARLMVGFNIKNNRYVKANQPPPERVLQLFPTLGFDLSPNTQLRLWDENGIAYSPAGGKWFVPLDAMLTHRVSNHLVVALGVARSVISTYPEYKMNIYGKISWYF